jgi:hypothetical protein
MIPSSPSSAAALKNLGAIGAENGQLERPVELLFEPAGVECVTSVALARGDHQSGEVQAR